MRMAPLNEEAQNYEPPATTKNIAELDKVSVSIDLQDDEFEFKNKQTGLMETVKQKVIIVNDEKYRVPVTVIQQLKVLLEDNPTLKFFKTKRTGTTRDDTRYQCIPVLE